MIEKKWYEERVGHTLRFDTYFMLEEMRQGKSYEEAKEYVLEHYSEHLSENVKNYFVKEKTIKEILTQIQDSIDGAPEVELKEKKKQREGRGVVYSLANSTVYLDEQSLEDKGIYGIFLGDKLIYVGMTITSFKQRWRAHIGALKAGRQDRYIYRYLSNYNENIYFKPLIKTKNIKLDRQLTREDLEMMELALITLYQPCCNVEGRTKPYGANQSGAWNYV